MSHHVQHSLLCHCLLLYLCLNICLLRSFQGLSGKLTRDTQDCEHTRDVLLGVASVPMLPLVATHKGHSQSHTQSLLLVTSDSNVVMLTGIAGWFPVYSRGHHHPSSLPSSSCLAGVELSCSFPRESDHHHIIATATATGWTPPPTLEPKLSDVLSEDTLWQFIIAVDSVQLPASSCEISLPPGKQYKSCFVRYKFFDKGGSHNSLCLYRPCMCNPVSCRVNGHSTPGSISS